MSLLYVWWLFLSAEYLFKFWTHPLVAGADGSGHVAALHLYYQHVYPALDGWIPELFGGMPFPVYYPPLFYWSGATVMSLTGIDATHSAKLLTTLSFAALPGVLYGLGRSLGFTTVKAVIAAALTGVVACGSNIVSLSGIGLLGLFEVGLFTQTLGFVFFCWWAACLSRAGRSLVPSLGVILFLVAAILSNAHILPLIAFYAVSWLFTNLRRTIRQGASENASRVLLKVAITLLLLIGPLLICGIWLVPLLRWYPYAVGQTLSSTGLFNSLGSLNVVWPVCAYVGWRERNRRRHLSSLCLALLITAGVALTPLADHLKYIPFQPPRVIAGALLLCAIPVTHLVSQLLTDIFGGKRRALYILAICTLALAWLHPIQRFGVAALSQAEADQINVIRAAVKHQPPGKLLVEIVEPKAIFNSPETRTRELVLSRALTHEIARDGRPILWSVFREQSLVAPYATAVSNLFSTTKETFGLNGIALQRSEDETVSIENRFRAAGKLNVSYFLVRTTNASALLQNAAGVRLLWSINGWTLFGNIPNVSADMRPVSTLPVFAWMPAKSKSRSAEDIDLFNLGEQLAFEGHPDVLPLWAHSEGVNVWDRIDKLQHAIVVIDPASVPSDRQEWVSALFSEARKLKLVLLSDGSPLAAQIHERQHDFASFTSINLNQVGSHRDALATLVREISALAETSGPGNGDLKIWPTSFGYFPTWQTADGQSIFLTGQGTAAVLSVEAPYLTWHSRRVRLIALSVCFVGVVISAGCLCAIFSAARRRTRRRA